MRHIVICGLPALQYSSTLPHKRHYFRKKKMWSNIKCVVWFFLQLLSEKFLILRRDEQYMTKNVYWSSRKVPVILQITIFPLKIRQKMYSWRSKLPVITVRETCWPVLRYFRLFLSTGYSEWRKNALSLITYSDLECFTVKWYWWKLFFVII